MKILQAILLVIAVGAVGGCAICCSPYFDDYPTYGGRVQRSNPEWGRVGSIFSDPYTAGSGPSADSNLKVYERQPARRPNSDILPRPNDIELPSPADTPGSSGEQNASPLIDRENGATRLPDSEFGRNSWRSREAIR